MSKKVTPRKCSECGKRRIPAKRSNGRLSTKCKECFGGLFWASAFGRWFAEAATRQSPDSMPLDEVDIKRIYELWLTRKRGIGYTFKNGHTKVLHDYHICHRDPAKGKGFQGRFTAGNLMVATVKANKAAYNADPIDHGYRVYTTKRPFKTAEKVRQWCNGQYDLNGIVRDLDLKKYSPPSKSIDDIHPEFLPKGVHPQVMLENQLNRFEGSSTRQWRRVLISPNEAFHDVLVYGIGLGNGQLKEPDNDCNETDEYDF